MKIAIYGKTVLPENVKHVQALIDWMKEQNIQGVIHHEYDAYLKKTYQFDTTFPVFKESELQAQHIACLLSIGGDGTALSATLVVGNSGIPIVGFNIGRLGFLTSITKDTYREDLQNILQKKYTIESRTMLCAESTSVNFNGENIALNEITVIKKDSASMIQIKTWLDEEFFCTYWSDGLIISTPTGSTGYSLSCGGPIILPDTKSIIITPIAPHNLNMRPVIIKDTTKIKLQVESRSGEFLCSFDGRSFSMPNGTTLHVSLNSYNVNFLKFHQHNYIQNLRDKLFWGNDNRN